MNLSSFSFTVSGFWVLNWKLLSLLCYTGIPSCFLPQVLWVHLKKSESLVHWILIQMYGVRYGSFYLFSKSPSSCLKITYLKVHHVPMIWDATFTIHQISICIWANFWTSYSVSLLCLAIHAPNYTILIAGALWYVLISGRTYPHHTAFLFQFFCLFLIIISYQLQYQLQEKQKTQPIFSIFMKIMLNGYINIYLGHTEHVTLRQLSLGLCFGLNYVMPKRYA